MKSRIFNTVAVALLAVTAAFSSCTLDERIWGGEPVSQNKELTIRIAVPGNARPDTRALGATDEYAVSEIAVLAFDANDQTFYGRYPGFVTDGPTGTGGAAADLTFQVSLPLGEFDLMVVANAHSMLDAASATLVKGAAQTAVTEAIRATMNTSGWDVTAPVQPLPMWGYKTAVRVPEDFTGANTTLNSTLHLTRMVAKVDIQLGQDLIDAGKFKLQSVRVYNYSEQGRLIPRIGGPFDWENVTLTTLKTLQTPTLPTAGYTQATSASEWIDYTLAPNATALERSIYLFEAAAGVSPVTDPVDYLLNPCLVIGGSYNNGPTTYYRVDFAKDTDTNPNDAVHNWQYLPLMRNNSYTITVTDITGNGHGSQDNALKSAPVNIETSIVDWTNDKIKTVITNGAYMLGVSDVEFSLTRGTHGTTSLDNILTIVTDHTGGWNTKVWDTETGTGTANSAWLTLSTGSVAAADAPDGTEVHLLAAANTGAERTAWVHVTAGNITLKVKAVQGPGPGLRNTGNVPGVIGYIHHPGYPDHHTLTLDKDDDSDANGFVYIAYFKFGSLVATSSRESADPNNFTSDDIVAWPDEWKSTTDNRVELKAAITGSGATAWNSIQFVTLSGSGQELTVDGASQIANNKATGDPCVYWSNKNSWNGAWRLPTAKENIAFVGRASDATWTPGNVGFTISNAVYMNRDGNHVGTVSDPGNGSFPIETGGRVEYSEVLPASGLRGVTGAMNNQGAYGAYWSSTTRSGMGHALYFYKGRIEPVNMANFKNGFAVRCVQN